MRAPRLAATLAALVLLATGCTSDAGGGVDTPARPSESRVDVDTPELRTLKTAAGIEDCPVPDPAAEPGALPSISVACLGGGPDVDLSLLRGPMIVNFWQAACQPCRTEMPILGEFHRKYGAQVPVIGIDLLDTLPVKAVELAGERGATYPHLADPGGEVIEEAAFARARSLPFTAFIDANGVIASQKPGEFDSLEDLVEATEKSLGVDLGGGG